MSAWDDAPQQPLSAGRRVFAWFLVLVAVAWLYVLLATLTRALPAVLPGQRVDVPVLSPLLEQLPGDAAVRQPSLDSPFNDPVTILVLGADRRPDEDDLAIRTDSIVVFRLDPATNRASALSIPRDLWVDISLPDGTVYGERINASYQAGALAGGSVDAGAAQVARDLEANFGIVIDHYLWVDIRDAARVIDAIGGIDLDIPEELAVPEWYYTDDDVTNPVYLTFAPGKQHLDGYRAVAFARYRNDSDLYRIQRQQLVLRAMLERIFSWRGWLNPFSLASAAGDAIQTDIPYARLPGVALLGGRAAGSLALFSLGDSIDGVPTVFPIVTEDGAQVLGWDPANVAAIWAQAQATR